MYCIVASQCVQIDIVIVAVCFLSVVYIRLPMIRHGQGLKSVIILAHGLILMRCNCLCMMTDITSSLLNAVYITRKLLLLIDVLALCKEN